ncbi:hypothetical protein [Ruminococcus sp.]|uniref:hypothetical protein n=1 Tax=Ruminococcus sp. TaxID=41978 RepID=UPI0025F377E9|nr:hypothetical protein [Ruminococcus sp.]
MPTSAREKMCRKRSTRRDFVKSERVYKRQRGRGRRLCTVGAGVLDSPCSGGYYPPEKAAEPLPKG